MNNIDMELQTLTPLWTGGSDKKVDRIHETGLLGSLRWWYEALVRGLGGDVCDSVSSSCVLDAKKYTEGKNRGLTERELLRYAGLCDACQLFGATGWRRRFRLSINGGEHLFAKDKRINIVAPGGNRGWYFGAPLVATPNNPISGNIYPLCNHNVVNDVVVLLVLIDRWGGLGARTQHGHGVVRLTLKDKQGQPVVPNVDTFVNQFSGDQADDKGFPALRNMFFARLYLRDDVADTWWRSDTANLGRICKTESGRTSFLQFKDTEVEHDWRLDQGFSFPIAPAIKYKLRYGRTITVTDTKMKQPEEKPVPVLAELESDKKSKAFFGYTERDNRRAAMFNISNVYKDNGCWQFRLWGWMPQQNIPAGINRNRLLKELHDLVTVNESFWDEIFGVGIVNLKQTVWREMNSDLDTQTKQQTDASAFLRSLLQGEDTQP